MARRTANTAGRPRATSLKANSTHPAGGGKPKPNVLVRGKGGSTGH